MLKDFRCKSHTFKSPVLPCLIVGFSWLLIIIIDFSGGYLGFPLPLLLIPLPAALLPLLSALIFTLIVLLRSIWSIIHLRQIKVSLTLIIITLAFYFMPSLLKERPFMLGFKYRTLSLSSPEELQEIAGKARSMISESGSGYLPGPGKWSLWEEENHRVLWEQMPEAKILSSFDSSVVICVSDNNCVDLIWGGALVGHWGIRIAEQPLEKSKFDIEFISITPNIAVFMSEH